MEARQARVRPVRSGRPSLSMRRTVPCSPPRFLALWLPPEAAICSMQSIASILPPPSGLGVGCARRPGGLRRRRCSAAASRLPGGWGGPPVVHNPPLHRRKVGGGRAEGVGRRPVAGLARWLSSAASRLLCPQANPARRAAHPPRGRRRPASCSFLTGSSRTSAPGGGRQVALAGQPEQQVARSSPPEGGAVHRAPRSRPPQRARWQPFQPLSISRLPGSDSQQKPPAQSRIGHTRPGPTRAPPPFPARVNPHRGPPLSMRRTVPCPAPRFLVLWLRPEAAICPIRPMRPIAQTRLGRPRSTRPSALPDASRVTRDA